MKKSISIGILLGITLIVAMGIVFIDTTQNFLRVGGAGNGFVQLIVSNKLVMTVSTNLGTIGIGPDATNNTSLGVLVTIRQPATNATGSGALGGLAGVAVTAAKGGGTFDPTSATAGAGGGFNITSGNGGDAPLATTNAIGGVGGDITVLAGTGGQSGVASVATNSQTGGNGGSVTFQAGAGGRPGSTASSNVVTGNGGDMTFSAGNSQAPGVGRIRKSGNGGSIAFGAGNSSGNTVRTNSGDGGGMTFTAGGSGNVTTAAGNAGNPGAIALTAGSSGSAVAGGFPSPGGSISLTAGNGNTGDTNSNGGSVLINGGNPGSGAAPGNVVLARASGNSGGVMVGPLLGGSASITNVLGGVAALDFPSTAAGTISDLPITVIGVTSNNCAVALSVPWQSASGNGGVFSYYNSNDSVYIRFANNNLVTAIDPAPGDFTVVAFRIR